MDPDPGSPKTCGSGFGSRSATLNKKKFRRYQEKEATFDLFMHLNYKEIFV
jgi:hypothetical protein